MVARLQGELSEREQFVQNLVETAQADERDLNPQEMELVTRSQQRIQALTAQINPLADTQRVVRESRAQLAVVDREVAQDRADRAGAPIEYRSTGAYIVDRWRAGVGDRDADHRLDLFHRAAAHQTTGDNPGVIPERVLGPVIQWIDAARPTVAALGPQAIPGGPTFYRPRVTQHTRVGIQTAEKTELVSQKMTLDRVAVNVDTYGGYVNISRQNIDWSQPQIMDIVVNDLAAQYALQTEDVTTDAIAAAATAGPVLPADATAQDIAGALWSAAATAYAASGGQGRLIAVVSPDMLGVIGPLFAPINPQNAQSSGFSAGSFGQGVMGAVSGITVVMSAALPAGSMFVLTTAAAEVFEQRIGTLSVTEPSVLGVQVAYAGYFGAVVLLPAGVISITKGA